MKRDPARLADERFDVLVVGGGVHGAAAARAAALLGLRTALIEQGDFGHATSANSLKIIHGGLRYLQRGNLRMVREGVRARRQMLALFPRLVAPLPCAIPTSGLGMRGQPALAAALALNDLLSADRNRGLPPASRLPRGRILGRAEMLRLAPGLDGAGVTGGALWHDGLAEDTERLVLALVLDAAEHGACAANYVRAEGWLREGGAVAGVRARDLITGADFAVRARLTLNAAGPWLDLLDAGLRPASEALPLAKAVNIVVGRRLFGECAVGLAGRSGTGGKRFFFFVPWRGGTMIGTLYLPFAGRPEECAVTAADLELMTAEINRIHPAARLTPGEVRFAHVGVLPLAPGTPDDAVDAGLLLRPAVIDGARAWGIEGIVAIRSVKYTSACRIADDALALAARKLGLPPAAPQPLEPLPERLLGQPPAPGNPIDVAALVRGIREEAALTLSDLVFRRTPLGTFGNPGREALAACAAVAAAELGWDEGRRAREIAAVEAEYRRLLGGRVA
jgi:glycerol-3-phosphate dehydrogenase